MELPTIHTQKSDVAIPELKYHITLSSKHPNLLAAQSLAVKEMANRGYPARFHYDFGLIGGDWVNFSPEQIAKRMVIDAGNSLLNSKLVTGRDNCIFRLDSMQMFTYRDIKKIQKALRTLAYEKSKEKSSSEASKDKDKKVKKEEIFTISKPGELEHYYTNRTSTSGKYRPEKTYIHLIVNPSAPLVLQEKTIREQVLQATESLENTTNAYNAWKKNYETDFVNIWLAPSVGVKTFAHFQDKALSRKLDIIHQLSKGQNVSLILTSHGHPLDYVPNFPTMAIAVNITKFKDIPSEQVSAQARDLLASKDRVNKLTQQILKHHNFDSTNFSEEGFHDSLPFFSGPHVKGVVEKMLRLSSHEKLTRSYYRFLENAIRIPDMTQAQESELVAKARQELVNTPIWENQDVLVLASDEHDEERSGEFRFANGDLVAKMESVANSVELLRANNRVTPQREQEFLSTISKSSARRYLVYLHGDTNGAVGDNDFKDFSVDYLNIAETLSNKDVNPGEKFLFVAANCYGSDFVAKLHQRLYELNPDVAGNMVYISEAPPALGAYDAPENLYNDDLWSLMFDKPTIGELIAQAETAEKFKEEVRVEIKNTPPENTHEENIKDLEAPSSLAFNSFPIIDLIVEQFRSEPAYKIETRRKDRTDDPVNIFVPLKDKLLKVL